MLRFTSFWSTQACTIPGASLFPLEFPCLTIALVIGGEGCAAVQAAAGYIRLSRWQWWRWGTPLGSGTADRAGNNGVEYVSVFNGYASDIYIFFYHPYSLSFLSTSPSTPFSSKLSAESSSVAAIPSNPLTASAASLSSLSLWYGEAVEEGRWLDWDPRQTTTNRWRERQQVAKGWRWQGWWRPWRQLMWRQR